MQADIEHIQGEMARWNYRFEIVELGGATPKVDRIRALMPKFERGNIYFPPTLRRTLYDRSTVDLVDVFVEEEYMAFPVGTHDDMLDALARITDPEFAQYLKVPGSERNRRRREDLPKFCSMGDRHSARDWSRGRDGPRRGDRDKPNMSWTFDKGR
jgi:hypothetical protein